VRVFVAGATGVIGVPVVRLLVAAGHEVAGMTRTPGKAGLLRELGAEPVVCDVYDAEALAAAVAAFAPDAVVHELTDLPDVLAAGGSPANARMRREGTRNLLAAAGAVTFLAQSIAWAPEGDGATAKAELETAVLAAGGIVLRYGRFYGPGTYYPDEPPAPPRVTPFAAAARTVDALDAPPGSVLTVVE
jgi:nucleoside-diphosphate-sugar epimerase